MGTSIGGLASAIPFLLIGAQLLWVWIAPNSANGHDWIRFGVSLALLEFILAHSGFFFGAKATANVSQRKRMTSIVGIGLFYFIFAIGFSLISGGIAIIQIFVFVMIGRFITIVWSSKQERSLLKKRAITAGVAYFALIVVFSTVHVPEFGITREVARSIDWGGASGLWIREPHRPIAMMTVYFFFLAFAEIFYFGRREAEQ